MKNLYFAKKQLFLIVLSKAGGLGVARYGHVRGELVFLSQLDVVPHQLLKLLMSLKLQIFILTIVPMVRDHSSIT